MKFIDRLSLVLRSIYFWTSIIILAFTYVYTDIPAMIKNLSGNIDNAKNNYGSYTLVELENLAITNPQIEKIAHQKEYLENYFSKQFSSVEIEESVLYIKSGTTVNFRITLLNEATNAPSIYVQTMQHPTHTTLSIRFNTGYNGYLKDSFEIIDKEQLDYICHYFDINNAYDTFENIILNFKEGDNVSKYMDEKNIQYQIYIGDYYDPNVKTKIVEFEIRKTL